MAQTGKYACMYGHLLQELEKEQEF